jgi:hypothetical protein
MVSQNRAALIAALTSMIFIVGALNFNDSHRGAFT